MNMKNDKNIFTSQEILFLWENMESLVDCDILIVAVYTGMRVNELLTLKVEDVNLKDQILLVRGTKTKYPVRPVPVHDKILPLFEKRIGVRKEGMLYYPENKNEPHQLYRNRFAAINTAMGKEHTMHDTRHTFIARWMAQGLDDISLRIIIGHVPERIAESEYESVDNELLLREINKLVL